MSDADGKIGRLEGRVDANDYLLGLINTSLQQVAADVGKIRESMAELHGVKEALVDQNKRIAVLELARERGLGEKTVWTMVCGALGSAITIGADLLIRK